MTEGNGLPDGWSRTPLGSVTVAIVGGGTPPRKDASNFGGNIVWLTPTEIPKGGVSILEDSREKLTDNGLARSSARWIPENSVLLTSRASIGYVAIAGTSLTTNQGFASFILPEGIEPKFLAWWLKHHKGELERLAGGTTFKEISKGVLRDVDAPVAPTNEQRRVVAAIEEQFSRLDAGVAALERVRANLKRYRTAVLKAAVEGRLTESWRKENPDVESAPELLERMLKERRVRWEKDQLVAYEKKGTKPPKNWQSKYKEPVGPDAYDLPESPKGWCWVSVEQLADVSTGATPLRSRVDYYENGTIPWVTSGALNRLLVTGADEYITEKALSETNAKIFPSGSLLIAMYGEGKTRGKVAELMIEAATNQACAALVFNSASKPCQPYVKQFMLSRYLEIRRSSAGGVQPNLNLSVVRRTPVALPPLREQEQIVAEIERRLSILQEVDTEVQADLKRAERLRQSVLKRAFEGKLVPQDPSDEPASELLERIGAEREQSSSGKRRRTKKSAREDAKEPQPSLFPGARGRV